MWSLERIRGRVSHIRHRASSPTASQTLAGGAWFSKTEILVSTSLRRIITRTTAERFDRLRRITQSLTHPHTDRHAYEIWQLNWLASVITQHVPADEWWTSSSCNTPFQGPMQRSQRHCSLVKWPMNCCWYWSCDKKKYLHCTHFF